MSLPRPTHHRRGGSRTPPTVARERPPVNPPLSSRRTGDVSLLLVVTDSRVTRGSGDGLGTLEHSTEWGLPWPRKRNKVVVPFSVSFPGSERVPVCPVFVGVAQTLTRTDPSVQVGRLVPPKSLADPFRSLRPLPLRPLRPAHEVRVRVRYLPLRSLGPRSEAKPRSGHDCEMSTRPS